MKITDLAYTSPKELRLSLASLSAYQVGPSHIHEMSLGAYVRIVYIESGSADFVFVDKTITATSRDVVYLPPHSLYSSYWDNEKPSQFFVLDISLATGEGEMIDFGNEAGVLISDTAHVYGSFYRDIKLLPHNTPLAWLERNVQAINLFQEIASEVSAIELGQKYRQIYKGIIYIEKNYTENFTIKEIADMCYMSAGHFRKLFLLYKQTSPIYYRNSLRIRRASELLKSGLYSVAQAGEAVGFDDMKYFSKIFKKYTGVCPKSLT